MSENNRKTNTNHKDSAVQNKPNLKTLKEISNMKSFLDFIPLDIGSIGKIVLIGAIVFFKILLCLLCCFLRK
ncbi:hypothetical protein GVAV_002400 [Gurleya vavrai]